MAKIIAFTLCSNNYLANAKVLAESFLRFHPSDEFKIGLVDVKSEEVDYDGYLRGVDVIPVADLEIEEFDEMNGKFDIVELNTAVKPSYFKYLFRENPDAKIIYLDPDIQVYSSFDEVIQALDTATIVITPQNTKPIDDGDAPSDINLLSTGVFNLGFIALANVKDLWVFLEWWHARLVKYGFSRPNFGMFYDQIWINLVPAFFDSYYVLRHPGYNMAVSNLHERKITQLSPEILVNGSHKLRFYHFSGYKFSDPEKMCSYSNRYTLETRKDVAPLFREYFLSLKKFDMAKLSKLLPAYGVPRTAAPKGISSRITRKIKRIIKEIIS
jgi:hypothetical protein